MRKLAVDPGAVDFGPTCVPAGRGITDNSAERFADLPIMEGINNNLVSLWAMNVATTQGGGIPLGWYSTGALIGASYGLSAGTYTGHLDLFHNDPAAGNPLVLPASLTVQPCAQAAAAR